MKNIILSSVLILAALISQAQFSFQTLGLGFNNPLAIAAEPITDYLYIVEQDGRIMLTTTTGATLASPFLDIESMVLGPGEEPGYSAELGLLGMAFHPKFDLQTNPYFYLNYTANDGAGRVSKIVRFNANQQLGQPNLNASVFSAYEILTYSQPYSNHNGGHIAFGPDGYLYIGTGDGGSGNDPQNFAQNYNSLLGKMLRIDIDNDDYPLDPSKNYAIPNDNSFQGLPEIYSIGLRNPWRYSFDKATGDLWLADVGQNAWEELNYTPANMGLDYNYGWRCYEGNVPSSGVSQAGCPPFSSTHPPIYVYPHNFSTGGYSITGGYVYRGCDYPALYGTYIFADYSTGNVWSTDAVTQVTGQTSLNKDDISSFGESNNNELYYVTLNGEFGRVTGNPSPDPSVYLSGQIQSGKYEADHSIITDADIIAGRDVEMKAGMYVEGEIGFQVDADADALLEIDPINCP